MNDFTHSEKPIPPSEQPVTRTIEDLVTMGEYFE